ncbi:MAG TPA: FecR domain-containing protein [Polyangia bacterium]|jgi:hypothetical protein
MADLDDPERDDAAVAPEVIARAAAGDRDAQQAVLEATCDVVRRGVFGLTGDPGPLDELHVAAMARILADLPHAPVEEPLGPWLAGRCGRVVRRRGAPAAGAPPPPLPAVRRAAAIAAALAAARAPAPRPWYVRRRPVLVVAGAVLVMLGVAGVAWLGSREQDAWIVAGSLAAGDARLGAGARLVAGDYVVPADAPVALALGHAAVLRAGGGTRFTLRRRSRVELDRGRLELALRPQARVRPVVIATQEAVVRVVGTQLAVIRPTPDETTVAVTEGTVEVTARASGRITKLRAGEALAVPAAPPAPPRR